MYRGALDSNKVSQYQRAVTPTIDPPHQQQPLLNGAVGAIGALAGTSSPGVSSAVRGKVLSYNPPPTRSTFARSNTGSVASGLSGSTLLNNNQFRPSGIASTASNAADITIQGVRSTNAGGIALGNTRSHSMKSSEFQEQLPAMSTLPRYDLIPLSDDLPADGIVFAKIKPSSSTYANVPSDTLVVFRTAEERLRNPERLNLDRRQLDHCPLLEQEQRLRLLNYQNNSIKFIANLENLPNLIFLDLYNNKIVSLEGPLSQVKGLRVLMAGKNRITKIANLTPLKKLDVLDLHSNELKTIEGLEGLTDLRVLNLAGNRITHVDNLSSLSSLTELNLRRNQITHIFNLQQLPVLQRIFLSHNHIANYVDVACIFSIVNLIELSLDNNPLADKDPQMYRMTVLSCLPNLKHLDLKKVTEEERSHVQGSALSLAVPSLLNEMSAERDSGEDAARLSLNESESSREQLFSDSAPAERSIPVMEQNFVRSASVDTDLSSKDLTAPASVPPSPAQTPVPVVQSALSSDLVEDDAASTAAGTGVVIDSTFEAKTGRGLAALARAGRMAKTQNVFDIEIVAPDEKVLIASGEKWELNVPRKLLLGVTEMCLLHLRRDQLVQKIQAAAMHTLPALKTLRFLFNDFSSIKHVEFIHSMFATVEHLSVRESPLNATSESVLASYLIAHMPRLLTFNDSPITVEDRRSAEEQWRSVNAVRNKAVKVFLTRNLTFTSAQGAGNEDDKVDGTVGGEMDGDAAEAEASATGAAAPRSKPSSLASLLRSVRDYSTGNASLAGSGMSSFQHSPALGPSPWQINVQNKMSFAEFSKEFDQAVLEIVRGTLKDIQKQ